MSVIYEQLEPGVIDLAMIEKSVVEQGPTGEAGRLAALHGVVLEEIEVIRLEFQHILKIDHLWMMTSLVKLQIGNNIIEKIENLDKLVNLKELDLSFNNIEEILNIHMLVNLEILTLFENRITKIKNMENLVNLMIFSIGNNQITDWDNVLYLRQFKKLRSLNLAGNPCTEEVNFKHYIYAFLPNLTYYSYCMITPTQREDACKRYPKQLRILAETDKVQEVILEEKRIEEEEVAMYSKSFIEYLNDDQLFKAMFVNDEDGNALLTMNEESEELYEKYHADFVALTQQLFNLGLEQRKIRQVEIDQFHTCVGDARNKCQTQSRLLMEAFVLKKAEIFYRMRIVIDSIEDQEEDVEEYIEKMQQCADDFHDYCQKTWQEVMNLELTLHEQLEETNSNFERNLNDVVGVFIEGAQGLFVLCRNLEMTFNETLAELGTRYLTNINVRMDDPLLVIPTILKPIMIDKESLNNAISTSHDAHLQAIDGREDILITNIRAWANEMCETLQNDEVKRDRRKIIEINHFMDIQREEFDELQVSPSDILLFGDQ